MIIYKSNRYQTLFPVTMLLLIMAVFAVPVKNYFAYRATNTDALAAATTPITLARYSYPEKTAQADIAVPKLATATAVKSSTPVVAAKTTSSCANTPTPGAGYLSICGRLIPLSYHTGQTAGVSPGAGLALKQIGYNFLFGHNSADVFGGLHAVLQPGDPLIVNYGATPITYHFNYYRQNVSRTVIDQEFLPTDGGATIAMMTCAPWVVDGSADPSRYGFIFTR